MENKFYKLAVLASKERWCWNLYCTLCGHAKFRDAFTQLAEGKTPNGIGWQVYSSRGGDERYRPAPRPFKREQKKRVLECCLQGSLRAVSNSCRFPDWLGYMGLVLEHMKTTDILYSALSTEWAAQLYQMVTYDSEAAIRLEEVIVGEAGSLLTIKDLALCEKAMSSDRWLMQRERVLISYDLGKQSILPGFLEEKDE